MLEFEVLASSSEGCCYVLRSGDSPPLLLDAGISFKSIQKGLGFRASQLAACLLTHAHGDHIRGAQGLLDHAVTVYGSAETLKAASLAEYYAKPLQTIMASPGLPGYEPFVVEGWSIQPFEAVHDVPGTVGYFIAEPGGKDKLLYLTDSAYSPYTFASMTHIAIECNHDRELLFANARSEEIDTGRARRTTQTHMSIDTVLAMLEANNLDKLREVHLLHLSDANSNEAEFKRRVQEATGCAVYVAEKRRVA